MVRSKNNVGNIYHPQTKLLEGNVFRSICLSIAVADLHSKILDARSPLGVQILSISCSFWENLAKSYVGAPLESWRPLLREILDPPLHREVSVWGGICCPGGVSVQGEYLSRGPLSRGSLSRGSLFGGLCYGGPLPCYSGRAGSAHPKAMHSCEVLLFDL